MPRLFGGGRAFLKQFLERSGMQTQKFLLCFLPKSVKLRGKKKVDKVFRKTAMGDGL